MNVPRRKATRMVLVCPHCSRTMEISGEAPAFCAYCGQRLRDDQESRSTQWIETSPGGDDRPQADSETIAYTSRRSTATAELSQVAGYRLLRTLGSGGMGKVFEAIDERTEHHVAIKLIAPEFVRSRDAVERFRQEGKLASTIEHPRCVFVLGADEYEGRPYIIMELMPGATLQSEVERKGPLPVEEAVTKILDVIDGLRQAHRMGVIHRDVKPSNCFLDRDGRVKVGDFGLSKSLIEDDAHLTRTGAFVGTPLYASPEQIKGEQVDKRTDVYSVAATLYYLLTGRPPFKESDATATIARIVTESPPPPRSLRPALPAALDAVVLRGLERDRDRRWRDLDQFRAALRPFLPGRLSRAGLGLRLGAFLIDLTLFLLTYALVFGIVAGVWSFRFAMNYFDHNSDWIGIIANLAFILYYGVLEGIWGASVGKWLSELKVCRTDNGQRPGLGRGLLRAFVFYAIIGLGDDILGFLPDQPEDDMAGPIATIQQFLMLGTTTIGIHLAGVLILILPMRSRNGYQGPHGWLSGTQVASATSSARRRLPRREVRIDLTPSAEHPIGMGDTLGPFTLRGILRWEHDRKILLAKETTLERLVWIALRSRGAAPPSKTRQNLARAARPRWLTGGESAQWRWDAYLAPTGCSLADLAGNNGLPWTEVRPILEDLVEELDVASRDGTLPEVLSVDEVWVQPDGRVLLIDPLAPASEHAPEQDGTCRIFDLTLRVTAVSLEGYHKRDDTAVRAIHAPVPRHVAEIFDRLLGQGPSFTSAEELLSALHAGQSLPTEINRARRSAHLILQSALLLPGVIAMFWAAHAWRIGLLASLPTHLQTSMAFMPLLWPLLWIVWALLTHGGLTMRLSGMALVRCDNRPASRGLCGVRAALVWLPISAILTASMFAPMLAPSFPLLGMLIWSTALGLVMIGPILALLSPSRGLHDRILGTALVPA